MILELMDSGNDIRIRLRVDGTNVVRERGKRGKGGERGKRGTRRKTGD